MWSIHSQLTRPICCLSIAFTNAFNSSFELGLRALCVSLFVPLRNRWTPPSPSSIGGDRCWYLIEVFPVSNAIFVPKYSFEYRRIHSTNLYENGVKRNCIDLAKRFRTISVKKKVILSATQTVCLDSIQLQRIVNSIRIRYTHIVEIFASLISDVFSIIHL